MSEQLHLKRGDWESVCECMIADPARHSEVISLLQQLPTIQIDVIAKKYTKDLVKIDATGFAGVITSRLIDQINNLLICIKDEPEYEYALLSALFGCVDGKTDHLCVEEDGNKNEIEEKGNNGTLKPELSQEVLDRFLKLMCDIEPDRVRLTSSLKFFYVNL